MIALCPTSTRCLVSENILLGFTRCVTKLIQICIEGFSDIQDNNTPLQKLGHHCKKHKDL